MENFSDEKIIHFLGGSSKVGRMLGLTASAVNQWKTRGIPAGYLAILGARLEKESFGLIKRQDLFPTSYKLIWPELD